MTATAVPGRSAATRARSTTRPRRARWGAAWPLVALLAYFPVWWVLGLSSFALILFSVPMAVHLLRLPTLRVPPAFGWWLLFMVWVVASGSMLGMEAPGTLDGSFSARLPAFSLRLLNYVAATVAMLFALNLSERDLSVFRLARLQACFFLSVAVGGVLGMLFPRLSFPTPMEYILPRSITSSGFLEGSVHPSLAQVQGVLGYESARPSAPFVFTNIWGMVISLLLVWFVVSWGVYGSARRRFVCGAVVVASSIPIIYSLNRGVWIGLLVAVIYLCLRLAGRGHMRLLVGVSLGLLVTSLIFVLSPLFSIVSERVANPHSNQARENTSVLAVEGAMTSPILGYGSTRPVIGSAQSIAVGRTPDCPQCGNAAIGGAGQLWLLLIAQGFAGAALFIGFFARTMWIYRRDFTPIALGGLVVLLLSLVYLPFYGSAGMPLLLCLLAVAMLAKERQRVDADGPPPAHEQVSSA